MDTIKLFDSELKLMELLWENEGITAKELSLLAKGKIGWNKNTTYTIIKKLIEKNAIKRIEPNFVCVPLVSKEQVQIEETKVLINKLYNGSVNKLFSSFLASEKLTKKEIDELKQIINSYSESEE